MSVSIRISDDIYNEVMKFKADKVSINKTMDMLLELAVKGIEKFETKLDVSDELNNDSEDFSERIKRISECICEELQEAEQISEEKNNSNSDIEKLEKENSEKHIKKLENEIQDLKNSEEHFQKIENELSEISKMILENQKEVLENLKFSDDDFPGADVDYTTLVTAQKEEYYVISADRIEYPLILRDDITPWRWMKWRIKDDCKTATLEFTSNIIAVADFLHQKIMIVNPMEMQVWYPQQSDSLERLMLICERRVLKTFRGELPLWLLNGIQRTHDVNYNERLYAEQKRINAERKKRGLYEFECFRF